MREFQTYLGLLDPFSWIIQFLYQVTTKNQIKSFPFEKIHLIVAISKQANHICHSSLLLLTLEHRDVLPVDVIGLNKVEM
jgi:hypothetical protein